MTNTSGSGSTAKQTRGTYAEPPHAVEANLSEHDPLASEPETLARAKTGDRPALEALLAAVRPRLCAVALKKVHDRDDAEDVVQEAMMKVWKHLGRFEGRAALSTWLHRIVANTAIDHLRARRQGVKLDRRPDDGDGGTDSSVPDAVDGETPEELVGRAEVGAVVRGAMAELSPAHREVLSLREFDGESYEAIAAYAQCPVGTVMSRLHHARHRLAETLVSGHSDLLTMRAA
jgi:RNA polymerase sigma-70 factor (ECF subfamily)